MSINIDRGRPTLHPKTLKTPIKKIAPANPATSTQLVHHPPNTLIHPTYDNASTRMNIENANGSSGRGSRTKTCVKVGKCRGIAWKVDSKVRFCRGLVLGRVEEVDGGREMEVFLVMGELRVTLVGFIPEFLRLIVIIVSGLPLL